jgi:hypothetical protein
MTYRNSQTSTVSTTIDSRFENFTQAYIDMGHEPEEAAEMGAQRLQEDDNTLFPLYACTNFSTAKETVWLLEAASLLCAGSLYNKEALRLIEMVKKGLEK